MVGWVSNQLDTNSSIWKLFSYFFLLKLSFSVCQWRVSRICWVMSWSSNTMRIIKLAVISNIDTSSTKKVNIYLLSIYILGSWYPKILLLPTIEFWLSQGNFNLTDASKAVPSLRFLTNGLAVGLLWYSPIFRWQVVNTTSFPWRLVHGERRR